MRWITILLALSWLGCASNYYDTYKASHPDWYGAGPTPGASLHESLAIIYAPPVSDNRRFVSKLDVLRLTDAGPVRLTGPEIETAFSSGARETYAVVAMLTCRSQADLQVFVGEKMGWMLLPDGKLAAWDLPEYADRCTVFNNFRPADPPLADLEARVVAHRDAHFPRSMQHAGELYRKGLAYLAVGRIDDAEAMLAAGDQSFDVGARGERPMDFDTLRGTPVSSASEIANLRRKLASELLARQPE